jgi:hypothetical protein
MDINDSILEILKKIEGKEISEISGGNSITFPIGQQAKGIEEEYTQIRFDDFTLNIYNPIHYWGMESEDSHQLLGMKVRELKLTGTGIFFHLEGSKISIEIDLKEESYTGPEAIALYGPGNICIVF